MPRYALGAIPSPPDHRDLVAPQAPARARRLPERLDLRPGLQPIRNQGGEGTCVGFALASGVAGWLQGAHPAPGTTAPDHEILSPRDAYHQARQILPVQGDGAHPRAALKAFQRRGLLTEAVAPYQEGQRDWRPPAGAPDDRARNRIDGYARVGLTLGELAAAIADHGPLLATLEVDAAFSEVGPDGQVLNRRGDRQGWHAVVLAGYDLATLRLLVRNSWGEGWGLKGYAWLPLTYGLGEAWAVTRPNLTPGRPWVPFWEQLAPWAFLEG